MDVDSVKRPGWQVHELSWALIAVHLDGCRLNSPSGTPTAGWAWLARTRVRRLVYYRETSESCSLIFRLRQCRLKAEFSTTGTFKLRFSLHGIHASSHPNTEYISSSVVHERRHVVTI